MKYTPCIILFVIVLFSCEKEKVQTDSLLPGVYLNPEYSDNTIRFARAAKLPENEYGIQFNEDGSLVERKNIGWCGTPPISYGDFDGFWTRQDSTLYYTVDFWGGTIDLEWAIISLDNTQLIIQEIDQQMHMTE